MNYNNINYFFIEIKSFEKINFIDKKIHFIDKKRIFYNFNYLLLSYLDK